MEKVKGILFFLVIMGIIGVGLKVYAQPKIPHEYILSTIPSEVKRKIEILYSSSGLERAQAAYDLGEMGPKARSSVPFLIEIIGDDTSMVTLPSGFVEGLGYKITTPGKEAGIALKKITGKDFGEDTSKWRKWWEQNKDNQETPATDR